MRYCGSEKGRERESEILKYGRRERRREGRKEGKEIVVEREGN